MLEVQGLGKSFGSVQALAEVSFQVGQGEVFGLIGPDGAGKTTLFRVLPPRRGQGVHRVPRVQHSFYLESFPFFAVRAAPLEAGGEGLQRRDRGGGDLGDDRDRLRRRREGASGVKASFFLSLSSPLVLSSIMPFLLCPRQLGFSRDNFSASLLHRASVVYLLKNKCKEEKKNSLS